MSFYINFETSHRNIELLVRPYLYFQTIHHIIDLCEEIEEAVETWWSMECYIVFVFYRFPVHFMFSYVSER